MECSASSPSAYCVFPGPEDVRVEIPKHERVTVFEGRWFLRNPHCVRALAGREHIPHHCPLSAARPVLPLLQYDFPSHRHYPLLLWIMKMWLHSKKEQGFKLIS